MTTNIKHILNISSSSFGHIGSCDGVAVAHSPLSACVSRVPATCRAGGGPLTVGGAGGAGRIAVRGDGCVWEAASPQGLRQEESRAGHTHREGE